MGRGLATTILGLVTALVGEALATKDRLLAVRAKWHLAGLAALGAGCSKKLHGSVITATTLTPTVESAFRTPKSWAIITTTKTSLSSISSLVSSFVERCHVYIFLISID